MIRNKQETSPAELSPASPGRGLIFMLSCLGLFYGLITVVDPLL